MGIKFANSAFATLASGINSSATSITLTTGQGARFPSLSAGDYFFATLIDTSNNLEIVKCTARSTDVLTVTRGQESTTARAFSTGDRIELRITAQGLVDASGGLASGVLDIPGTSASGAVARLYEDTDNGTHYVGLKAAAAIASSLDFVLPSADGTNGQYLKTDGSKNLGFASLPSPKFVKATEFVNSTRQTFSAAEPLTIWSITYTKDSSTSDLYIHVMLPIKDTYNGGSYVGINIDGSTNFKGYGRATFSGESGMNTILQKRSGLAAGSRTISVYQDSIDNSANYVIPVLNPNSSDDGRNQQNSSVMVIYEIEP